MEKSDASSVSSASDSVDFVAHNIWNPMVELLFYVQIGGIFDIFEEAIDLARVALSCHFAHYVTMREPMIPLKASLGTIALCSSGYIKEADTSVDVVDASHKLRVSVPVKNSTLYPATLNAGLRGNGSRWIRNRDHCHCIPHFGCPKAYTPPRQ